MNDTTNQDNENLDTEGMSPEELEMMQMLEAHDDQAAQQGNNREQEPNVPATRAAEPPPSVEAHPVDITPLKEGPAATPPDKDGNLKLIMDIPVEIKVEVGNSRLTIREILNLSPGAIIELDRAAGSPADIIVNGTIVGQGDVVVVEESYGIRITKLVTPEDRLNSL